MFITRLFRALKVKEAPGETGKTFTNNLLLAKLRQMKHIAVTAASSGIAATLPSGGCTSHSCFKLPVDLCKKAKSTCNISRGFIKGKLLSDCKLLI